MVEEKWFARWFDSKEYHLLYGNRDETEAEIFITNIVEQLNLPVNSLCIDLACGKGRHTKTLGELGMKATGLDLSTQSINFAKVQNWPNTQFAVHDMRDAMPITNAHAVFNLFTSFGYFDTEEEDALVLQNVNKALLPGAYFVQDYLNTLPIIETLPQRQVIKKESIEFVIHKYNENNCIKKNIRFNAAEEVFDFTESVKNYSWLQLQELHKQAGFEIVKLAGNYQLEAFDKDMSPRVIIISKKVK